MICQIMYGASPPRRQKIILDLAAADPEFSRGLYQPIIRPNFPENCLQIKKIGAEQ